MWRRASCRCGARRAYIVGCSQAVWIDPGGPDEPALLRNYDFAPALLEGNWLATRWRGQRVSRWATACGARSTGMNEAGLAASLSFGGRTCRAPASAFRWCCAIVLEVAQSTAEAIAMLQRVPVT